MLAALLRSQLVSRQPVAGEAGLVSIVITSYNNARFLGQAIESALAQDYPQLEIVVSDNASDDGTAELLERYAHHPHLRIFRNPVNVGMHANFQLGAERARGQYLTFLSSDDWLKDPSFLSQAMQLVAQRPDLTLVFGESLCWEEDRGRLRDTWRSYADLAAQPVRPGGEVFLRFLDIQLGWDACLMRRDLLLEADVLRHGVNCFDWEANLMLMVQGAVGFVSCPSYVWRIHAAQASEAYKNWEPERFFQQLGFIDRCAQAAEKAGVPALSEVRSWQHSFWVSSMRQQLLFSLGWGGWPRAARYLSRALRTQGSRTLNMLASPKFLLLLVLYAVPRFGLPVLRRLHAGHHETLQTACAGRKSRRGTAL